MHFGHWWPVSANALMYWNVLAWWNTSVAVQPVSDTAESEIEIEREREIEREIERERVADFCFESLSCFELSALSMS